MGDGRGVCFLNALLALFHSLIWRLKRTSGCQKHSSRPPLAWHAAQSFQLLSSARPIREDSRLVVY